MKYAPHYDHPTEVVGYVILDHDHSTVYATPHGAQHRAEMILDNDPLLRVVRVARVETHLTVVR